jgi:glycosyltransferase involved in cell wall biosynthesis
MENKILTIVVPAYNVEPYVDRCLRSILDQDISTNNYEVVIVNDGSTDGTKDIVESYVGSNIIVINQENKGLSCARNEGLRIARGEYVWFVDSDDSITIDSIKLILEAIKKSPDIIALNYTEFHDDNRPPIDVCYKKKPNCGIDLLTSILNYPAQFYVYKKSFLLDNDLKFYPGIYHEDVEFTPRAVFLAKRISYIDTPLYFYYIHSNSITTTMNPKRAFDYLKISEHLISFDRQHDRKAHKAFMIIVSRVICNAFLIITKSEDSKRKEFVDYMTRHKYLYRTLIFSYKIKYLIRGVLLYLSGRYCVKTYSIIMKFVH